MKKPSPRKQAWKLIEEARDMWPPSLPKILQLYDEAEKIAPDYYLIYKDRSRLFAGLCLREDSILEFESLIKIYEKEDIIELKKEADVDRKKRLDKAREKRWAKIPLTDSYIAALRKKGYGGPTPKIYAEAKIIYERVAHGNRTIDELENYMTELKKQKEKYLEKIGYEKFTYEEKAKFMDDVTRDNKHPFRRLREVSMFFKEWNLWYQFYYKNNIFEKRPLRCYHENQPGERHCYFGKEQIEEEEPKLTPSQAAIKNCKFQIEQLRSEENSQVLNTYPFEAILSFLILNLSDYEGEDIMSEEFPGKEKETHSENFDDMINEFGGVFPYEFQNWKSFDLAVKTDPELRKIIKAGKNDPYLEKYFSDSIDKLKKFAEANPKIFAEDIEE